MFLSRLQVPYFDYLRKINPDIKYLKALYNQVTMAIKLVLKCDAISCNLGKENK